MLNVVVHPANVQDRDGAAEVLTERVRRRFPFIEVIHADAGYQGKRVRQTARKTGSWRVEIVKRPPDATGFVLLAKRVRRWPRTSGGLTAHRRAHPGLDQPQPPPRPRLREPRPDRSGLGPSRHDQDHAKALGKNMNFSDRL